MTELKRKALDTVHDLHDRGILGSAGYETIRDGIEEIEPLRDRDEALEELWNRFSDVPVDPDTECIEAGFLGWGPGIHREEIWAWFDQRYSKGIAYLMYHGIEDYVPETKRLYGLSKICFECESTGCAFNHGGRCRFALVHGRKPEPTDGGSCAGYVRTA